MDKNFFRIVWYYAIGFGIASNVHQLNSMNKVRSLPIAVSKKFKSPQGEDLQNIRKKIEKAIALESLYQHLQPGEKMIRLEDLNAGINGEGVLIRNNNLRGLSPTVDFSVQVASENNPADTTITAGIAAPVVLIKKLFGPLSDYQACLNSTSQKEVCLKKLKAMLDREMATLGELLSTFKLAGDLLINSEILDVFAELLREKIFLSFGKEYSFSGDDLKALSHIDNNLRESLFPKENEWTLLFQELSNSVMKYCLEYAFSGVPKIYSKRLINYYDISLNMNGSRIFISGAHRTANSSYSYVTVGDLKKETFGMVPHPGGMRPLDRATLWFDANTIACAKGGGKNSSSHIFFYDCLSAAFKCRPHSSDLMKIEISDSSEHLTVLQLEKIPGSQKMVFLYRTESDDKCYGIGIYANEKITKQDIPSMKVGNLYGRVRLVVGHDGLIMLFVYKESPSHHVFLYKLEQKGDSFDLSSLMSEFPVQKMDTNFNIFMNQDNTKLAFFDKENIVIMSPTDSQKKLQFSVEGDISSLAFIPQNEILIVAYKTKKIVAIDMQAGISLGELLSSHAKDFDENNSISFSEDGTTFAIASKKEAMAFVSILPLKADWQKKKNEYLKGLKFDKFISVISWYVRSEKGKEPVLLKGAEKELFHAFDPQIQKMLMDIKIVAEGQGEPEPSKTFSGRFWNAFLKYWPQSG
jgi:WD40 repeat protein